MVNINLVPQEIKDKIGQAKQSANVFGICLVVLFLLAVLGVLSLSVDNMLLEPNLTEIKDDIKENSAELTAFDTLENKAVFLNERAKLALVIEQQRPLWSQVVQNLINCVPQQVQFENVAIDISKSPNIVLDGYTQNERDIISFKDKLEASDFFKNVAFKSSTTESKPVETPAVTTAPVATTDPAATTTPAVAPAPTPVPTPIPTEKRVSFSLEFDLEKYFLTEEKN